MEQRILPNDLMVKKAWRIGEREGELKVIEEVERKDLNLLNMGLQMGVKFFTPSKELSPGFHEIALVNQEDKEVYAFLVDLSHSGDESYSGEATVKLTFTREALQDNVSFEHFARTLGFKPEELKTLKDRVSRDKDSEE